MTGTSPHGGNGRPAEAPLEDLIRIAQPTEALRVLLYGPEGVGKTSFGASAEDPVFFAADSGLVQLGPVPHVSPETWPELLATVRRFAREKHRFRSFVFDTLNWIQPMIVAYCCERDYMPQKRVTMNAGRPYIEGYGYGKGWEVVQQEWLSLQAELEHAFKRGINIVLLAHADVQKEKNVEGADYGIIAPAINKLASNMFRQWVDLVGFAYYETKVIDAGSERQRAKAVATGRRLFSTRTEGAHYAKSRFTLPEEMPLSWHALRAAIGRNDPAEADRLKRKIVVDIQATNDHKRADETFVWLASVGNDATQLRKFHDELAYELGEAARMRDELLAVIAQRGEPTLLEKTRALVARTGLNYGKLKDLLERARASAGTQPTSDAGASDRTAATPVAAS